MQRLLYIILITWMSTGIIAQHYGENKVFKRKGFTFGFSAGAGVLSVTTGDQTHISFAASVPNFRIGYMVHENFAIQFLQPGSPYRFEGMDRVYEGLLFSGQYWVKDQFWLQGGLGVTMDAPAFWTLPGLENPEFNFGFPAFSVGAGYEIAHYKNYSLDIQYRFYYGKANRENNESRVGVSSMVCLGLNLY